jgi:hypothetical protein
MNKAMLVLAISQARTLAFAQGGDAPIRRRTGFSRFELEATVAPGRQATLHWPSGSS